MSLGPLYVLLGEVFGQVLCPFFNWIVYFFGVESYKFLTEEASIYNGLKIVYSINGVKKIGQIHTEK